MYRIIPLASLITLLVATLSPCVAQQPVVSNDNIVERLEQTGIITIHQPAAVGKRLVEDVDTTAEADTKSSVAMSVGYRIQVFSDVNASTAKNEAYQKEKNLLSRFPNLPTYITYKAPAWRLRVGDFRNREEAEEMLREIKASFPSYSRELIIVRDRINH